MMYRLYEPGFATVVVYNTVSQMPYGADGKKNPQLRIKMHELVITVIE
jgi:hypothetical protein